MNLAADHVRHGGSETLVRNMHDVDPGSRLEHLDHQLSADRRAIRELPRLRLGERDELLDRRGGELRLTDDHERQRADLSHSGEIARGIERQVWVEARIDRQRRRREQQRVAIRARLRDEIVADSRARARPVVHDHALAPAVAQLLADQTREEIVERARR
jgi:hypothetical protein